MKCRHFIAGSGAYCTAEQYVAAPWVYRRFTLERAPVRAALSVAAQGLYRVFLNGEELTKGKLAPYLCNPEQSIRYDVYPLKGLRAGENVLAFLLGNGFVNAQDNGIWDFTKASYRSAPSLACELSCDGAEVLTSREGFFTLPSHILYDDVRGGERADGRLRLDPAHLSGGVPALAAKDHGGKLLRCRAHPVRVIAEHAPVRVWAAEGGGYLYDFGKNMAGVPRLRIRGERGQRVDLRFCEIVEGNAPDFSNLGFGEHSDMEHIQHDVYVCAGEGEEVFEPAFTYHGFRYAYVTGVTAEQATADLLTACEISSSFRSAGRFACSDETANAVQAITRQSDRANFVCFPTDCPHREKNGWTGDIALSCEQFLYNFGCAQDLAAWLGDLTRAQKADGQLPGIVPTGGWGFEWGCGPAWDLALIETPYRILQFTGDIRPARAAASAIETYLHYMAGRREADGTLAYGLGDWCEAGTVGEDHYRTPVGLTDTLVGMDICAKAARVLAAAGREKGAAYAAVLREELRKAFRAAYVRGGALSCDTQTAYAMALAYGGTDEDERAGAVARLKELIAADGGHFRVGVLGGRVLFDVLAEAGEAELAFRLIVQKSFPSYGYMLEHGATTLWEAFYEIEEGAEGSHRRKDGVPRMCSLDHHFWGFVSGWFYRCIAGLRVCSPAEVNVQPCFIGQLSFAEGEHAFPHGRILVRWERRGEEIALTVRCRGVRGKIVLPAGYAFAEGGSERAYGTGGRFTVRKL